MSEPKKEMSDGTKLVIVAAGIVAAFAAVVAFVPKEKDRVKTPATSTISTVSSVPDRYLDSRHGSQLETTVKSIIESSGYECGRVRKIEVLDPSLLKTISEKIEDGRGVDCGLDGIYYVFELPGEFRAIKH